MVFLSCAAQGPASGGPEDLEGPSVISVYPINKTTELELDTKIVLEFDEIINPISVQPSISIVDFSDYFIKIKRKKIIIAPKVKWPHNTILELNVSRRIRDYQNNNMNKGYQFIFSTGKRINDGSIKGKLENFNPQKITQLLLFSHPITDTSSVIKITESDQEGNFEFLYLTANNYTVFATESRSKNPLQAIYKNRYGINQSRYIPIKNSQEQKIHIYMDEPLERKQIVSINQINQQFGILNFSDDSQKDIYFSRCDYCEIASDTITIDSLPTKNRLENYILDSKQFLFEKSIDSVGPSLIKSYWEDDRYKLYFSEPIQLSDSILFESQFDSSWNPVSFIFNEKRDIDLLIQNGTKVRFLGTNIKDFYNNEFQNTLVELLVSKRDLIRPDVEFGGDIRGKIEFEFFNEIIVEVRNIDSNQISFVVSRDGIFEFNNLSPGKYLLRAFENKNLVNNEVYFSGLWSPYDEAASFGIYPDTIDVRSNWDIENINFKINNFMKE